MISDELITETSRSETGRDERQQSTDQIELRGDSEQRLRTAVHAAAKIGLKHLRSGAMA